MASLPVGVQLISDSGVFPQLSLLTLGVLCHLSLLPKYRHGEQNKQERLSGQCCAFSSHSPPLHVRVRAEASPRSILVPPPCSPDPSCCLSSFSCDRSADMRIPHRSSSRALCTRMHVLPRTFIGTLPWSVTARVHSASQQTALCLVSGVTLGAGVHKKPDGKGAFPLGADFPLGR